MLDDPFVNFSVDLSMLITMTILDAGVTPSTVTARLQADSGTN